MRKQEAIDDLVRWRREHQLLNCKHWNLQNDGEFLASVYADILAEELIEEIRIAPQSKPVSHILAECHDFYDRILSESDDDHFITHRFAGLMEMLTMELYGLAQ